LPTVAPTHESPDPVTSAAGTPQPTFVDTAGNCAVTSGRGVTCSGDGGAVDVVGPTTSVAAISAISTGTDHSCGLTSKGGVACWGSNGFGQLGNGTTTKSPVPVEVVGLGSGVVAITTGGEHTCALTGSGGVRCWGNNSDGELGTGTTVRSIVPVGVVGLAGGVKALSAGVAHTCALTSGGGLRCWGDNRYGQLGTGTTVGSLTPVDVVGLSSGVRAISAGGENTCAVTTAGGVLCWGYNGTGALGDGTTTSSSVPVSVASLASGIAAVSVNGQHPCALTSVGGVTCWGGGVGYKGTAPVDVPGLTSGVCAIAVGYQQLCALRSNGLVKCWGVNPDRELVDGSWTNPWTSPAAVPALRGKMNAIAAGGGHACAITSIGAVWCWGANTFGQLGNGTTSDSAVPVPVNFSVFQMPVLAPSVPPGSIDRGTTVTFSATVRPVGAIAVRPVVRFVIYRKESGTWRLAATRDVSADTAGRVSLRWGFVTPGSRYVRARVLADSTYGASAWGPLVTYEVR
jgi:alpha-tubulin suppressor-like RCC1 family protein